MNTFNKTIIVALLSAVAAPALASSNYTTIDFEVDHFKQVWDNNLNMLVNRAETSILEYENVTFSGVGRTTATGDFFFRDIQTTPDVSGFYLETAGQNFTALNLSFKNPVSDFSFNLGQNQNVWDLRTFDESGTEIELISFSKLSWPVTDNGGQIFSTSLGMASISSATFTNRGPLILGLYENSITLDNLRYTQAPISPIPEPSTYALMLGGLGMVGFMAYRRRKQAVA